MNKINSSKNSPRFGLLHLRLQTWLPFPIQVCINGREYLARQLAQEGIGFEQCDNSFSRIDALPRRRRSSRMIGARYQRYAAGSPALR